MSQKILVDMTPGFRQPTVYFSQGDIGTTFNVDLTSRFGDSLPASPTITLQATKPSGLGFSVSATSISGSIVTFTMTETMTNEAGRFPAELKIVNSGVTIYTANFYMQGEKSAHPEGTTDGDLDHILPRYMSVQTITLGAGDSASYSFDPETNTAIFGIPKGADGSLSSDVLAPTYSASATYSVGDYVYYNGALFRCTTAITTAEAWTSAHWAQVALAPEVTDLKSEITQLSSKTFEPDGTSESTSMVNKSEHGYYSPSNGAWNASDQYTTKYIDFDYASDFYIEIVTLNLSYIYCSEYSSHEPSSATFVRGFSYANNNLPSENNKLHIEAGHTITVSFYNTNVIKGHYTFPLVNNTLADTVILNKSQLMQANVIVQKAEIASPQYTYGLKYVGDGYYSASNGNWSSDSNYRAFEIVFNTDTEFYLLLDKVNQPYIFVSLYSEKTKSSATFLRGFKYSDNNIPSENNKLSVKIGQCITVSVYFTNTVSAVYEANIGGKNATAENKIVWFGDSLSQYSSLPDRVADYTGLNILNCTFAGSPMTYGNPLTQQAMGFLGLSSAIVSGDFTNQDDALEAQEATTADETYWELVDRQNHLAILKNIDFDTVTDIIVMLGTNDLNNSYVTTTASLDNFKYGMRTAITNILTEYPHIRMHFITDTWRGDITPSNPDQYGHSLVDIINAEKEVCAEFNLPIFDLYTVCGINSLNESVYLAQDKLHLKRDAGYVLIAKIIEAWLKSNN